MQPIMAGQRKAHMAPSAALLALAKQGGTWPLGRELWEWGLVVAALAAMLAVSVATRLARTREKPRPRSYVAPAEYIADGPSIAEMLAGNPSAYGEYGGGDGGTDFGGGDGGGGGD